MPGLRRLGAGLLHAGIAALTALTSLAAAAAGAPLALEMQVRLDPAEHRLQAQAQLRLPAAKGRRLVLDEHAQVTRMTLDGKERPVGGTRHGEWRVWRIPDGVGAIELAWTLELAPTPVGLEHRDTLTLARAASAERGSFLPAAARWYPSIRIGNADALQRWRITIDVPSGQRAIVPGRLVEEAALPAGVRTVYRMDVPAEGADLMAGPYQVTEHSLQSLDGRSLKLRTLFHPELAALAEDYLDALKQYFELYEQWIGPYPYDDFSIVSSPTPTGFGMPSLTYLGIDVLRLPFIRQTSLGHEVLHNWWGNGVYPDVSGGNWSEGLTTFMADYTFAQRDSEDKARDMRVSWLRDLSAIPPDKAMPLARFTSRTHGVSAAVGYGKAAMVFVMLRERIGTDTFDRAIRHFWRKYRFQAARWDDLRLAFEAESGQSLSGFFRQWLDSLGLPDLDLASRGGQPVLLQGKPVFDLNVPLVLTGPGGKREFLVHAHGHESRIELPSAASSIDLDPGFRVLRRLTPGETPPVMREINLAGGARLVALGDTSMREGAKRLAGHLLDEPAPDTGLASERAPLLLVGPAAEVDRWLAEQGLPPRPAEVGLRGDVQAWAGRTRAEKPLLVVSAGSPEALAAASRPLPHLGRYGWAVLEAGKSVDKGSRPAKPRSIAVVAPAPPSR